MAGSLITSKQIKDNTITSADVKNKTITSNDLANSALPRPGATGPAGPAGAPGPAGPAGPVTGDVPSGVTLRGSFYLTAPQGSPAGVASAADISPGLRNANGLPVTVVTQEGVKPPQCGGSIWNPTAAPGHICVFIALSLGYDQDSLEVYRQGDPQNPASNSATTGRIGPAGGVILAATAGTDLHFLRGVWAATAP
ncbi:hypothetical protein GCM10009795_005120 [Nocardioides hankookensis]